MFRFGHKSRVGIYPKSFVMRVGKRLTMSPQRDESHSYVFISSISFALSHTLSHSLALSRTFSFPLSPFFAPSLMPVPQVIKRFHFRCNKLVRLTSTVRQRWSHNLLRKYEALTANVRLGVKHKGQ